MSRRQRRPSRRHRARRPAEALAVLACLTPLLLTACGSSGTSQSDDVAAFRARAGMTAATAWSAQYRLDAVTPQGQATVDVAHLPQQLRLDITTGQGVATNISGPQGEVSCQTSPGRAAICVQAAAPGATPPAALDPALRAVMTTTVPAIVTGQAQVQALGASSDPAFAGATCARVSGEGVATGVYCLFADGVPASANFPRGSIAFVTRLTKPVATTFDPPASPRPR